MRHQDIHHRNEAQASAAALRGLEQQRAALQAQLKDQAVLLAAANANEVALQSTAARNVSMISESNRYLVQISSKLGGQPAAGFIGGRCQPGHNKINLAPQTLVQITMYDTRILYPLCSNADLWRPCYNSTCLSHSKPASAVLTIMWRLHLLAVAQRFKQAHLTGALLL